MHLEAVIERVWRFIWRLRSSNSDALGVRDQVELRDTLGGCDRESLEMHLEAEIVYLRDALGGCDRVSLEIHLEAMIDRDWRSTWRCSIWWR